MATEKALRIVCPGCEADKSGTIWKGPAEVMKYDGNRGDGSARTAGRILASAIETISRRRSATSDEDRCLGHKTDYIQAKSG